MNKDLIFSKLTFANDNEKNDFEKYVDIKGIFLYKQVYDYLLVDNDKVQYSILSSCIRYDKNLRDKLYIYLATAEEYLKKKIFDLYDLKDNTKFIFNKDCKKSKYIQMREFYLGNMILRDYENNDSNLYFDFKVDLGLMLYICKIKRIININQLTDWNNVRLLRNDVMHHQILSLPQDGLKSFDSYKIQLVNKIKSLANCLPEEFKNNFLSDINKLVCKDLRLKINI